MRQYRLMKTRARLPLTLTSLILLSPSLADAKLDLKKQYEEELISWALRAAKLKRDPKPHGKRIERIVIVRENIIADSDPWPTLLNVVHVKTREHIVRQELLVKEGDLWDAERVAESERNLRTMFILATARTVPCRSKRPGEVILLVVTKDIWSIRLNMAFSQNGSIVNFFDALPTEANFLGLNKSIVLHLRVAQYDFGVPVLRDYLALGLRYIDPRLLGSRLQLVQRFDLFIDGDVPCAGQIGDAKRRWCHDRDPGSIGGLSAGLGINRPLYSLATKWAFSLSGSIDIRQRRGFSADSGSLVLRTVKVQENLFVPEVYDGRRLEGSLGFTRSFGRRLKHDVSWGISVYDLSYTAPDSFPFGPQIDGWLEDYVYPRSESAATFYVSYRLRTTRFVRLRNVNGFALSEDFAIGPSASAGVGFGQNLREPLSFISLSASLGYRWRFSGDLLSVAASAATRVMPSLELPGYTPPLVNSSVSGSIRNITPVLGIGRLHTKASITLVEDDLNRTRYVLGGAGLRGYPVDNFVGRNLLRVNAEYRSLPINLFTAHLGFVLFYDGGSAFGNYLPEGDGVPLPEQAIPFRYYHSVGVGFRGHFPQFDRESLRVDFGVPLSEPRGPLGSWFTASFGQVF